MKPPTLTAAHFLTIRNALGLTQQQLAETIGYSRRQVIRFEAGTLPVPPVVAWALSGMEATRRRKAAPILAPPEPEGWYAVYDSALIWGIGRSQVAAQLDAWCWLDDSLPYTQRIAQLEDMTVGPATADLAAAVLGDNGGNIAFARCNGVLDLVD